MSMNKEFGIPFVAISILGLILTPTLISVNADEIQSPRQQMASGVDVKNVVCKSGLALMIRSTNGAAACVTPLTSEKLSDAGWGDIIKSAMEESEPETTEESEPETTEESEPETPEESEGNVIEVKIKDGVGASQR